MPAIRAAAPDGGTGGGDNIIALPTPEPNNPTAIVTASSGANVRTGPGTEYDIVGVLPQGTQAQIVGRSEDAAWWVLNVPPAPNNQGWVSVDLINARNADTVPVIYPPGTERPPSPVISFSADQMALAPGTCTTLQWQVENVAEVYVYPGGEPWQNYPVAGTGSQEVCPETTTIYEMRVVLTDGSVDTRGIRIEVTDAPTEDPLNGTGWRLETLFVNQLLLPGSTIDISFSTGSVAGNSGCNQYSGAYTVNGASLVFGPFVTTRRACTPDVDQQEQFYLQTLATTASFQSDGSQLVLYDAGGQEIARYRYDNAWGTITNDQFHLHRDNRTLHGQVGGRAGHHGIAVAPHQSGRRLPPRDRRLAAGRTRQDHRSAAAPLRSEPGL